MQPLPLTDVLNSLEQEMLRLGYSEGSMKFYRRRWQMLLQFAAGERLEFCVNGNNILKGDDHLCKAQNSN